MTIQQFIEKAIEGGWASDAAFDGDDVKILADYPFPMLLDPLAWKAVGEVEQWDLNFTNKWKKKAMGMMQFLLDEEGTIEQYLETL